MACATKDFINDPTMAKAVELVVVRAKQLGLRNVIMGGMH
jgi:hypothetical protein